MNMQSVTKAGEYTDKILSENFMNVAKGFAAADKRMDMLENGIRHLSGHIAELFEAADAAAKTAAKVKTPSRVKPFVVGAVVGVAAYRYSIRNRAKLQALADELKTKAEQAKTEVQSAAAEARASS